MRILNPLTLLAIAPLLATAHPDLGTEPGKAQTQPTATGNGAWTYEVASDWGALPEGIALGPIHGTVLVDKDNTVYFCTDSEASIIVWKEDGGFVKTIALEC